jgi:hypothetical protein
MLNKLISDLPRDRRPSYVNLILPCSISSDNRILERNLIVLGYNFSQYHTTQG